jgi:SAM-dependent methyltransferase
MDLRERTGTDGKRHPWELSRLKAIRTICRRIPIRERALRVLDVGCGDGFVSRELAKDGSIGLITGVDIHLSAQQIDAMAIAGRGVAFHNTYDALDRNAYNLALLMDVVEHVEEDRRYLGDVVRNYLEEGGYLVITVPAYPFLFGPHDRFLHHRRRYTRAGLVELVRSARLECLSSGYLFFSLLPIRFLSLCFERWFPSKKGKIHGVGSWKHGAIVTNVLEFLLDTDVRFGMALQQAGITLPGLTAWALCRKHR